MKHLVQAVLTVAVPLQRRIALGLALALLASGCVTYSKDKAIERMSETEKSMLAQLSKIPKGTTKAEVRGILGLPKRSESLDSWEYYCLNERQGTVQNTPMYTSPGMIYTGPGGKVTYMPGITMPLSTSSTSSTTEWESVVRVFFTENRVRRIHFVHPGLADGWAFDVLK